MHTSKEQAIDLLNGWRLEGLTIFALLEADANNSLRFRGQLVTVSAGSVTLARPGCSITLDLSDATELSWHTPSEAGEFKECAELVFDSLLMISASDYRCALLVLNRLGIDAENT